MKSKQMIWNGEVVFPSRLYRVPKLISVSKGEKTCTECYETFSSYMTYCFRCASVSKEEDEYIEEDEIEESFVSEKEKTPFVSTTSYLIEHEYYVKS